MDNLKKKFQNNQQKRSFYRAFEIVSSFISHKDGTCKYHEYFVFQIYTVTMTMNYEHICVENVCRKNHTNKN